MLGVLDAGIRRRFQTWLQRRLPPSASITLNHRRLFIMPSRAGFGFLGLLAIMLLAAINYQNNMVFAMVFLLASTFAVAILHTYANLAGLSVTALGASSAFAGGTVRFDLKVAGEGKRRYYDVILAWPDSEHATVSLERQEEAVVNLHLPASRRGWLRPPRLLVETFYPLGLLRCWTWLALDTAALVYPQPLAGDRHPAGVGEQGEGEAVITEGSDDFYALKDYQPGDPLKHIAWKAFAKGQPLQTKQFAAYREQRFWLDWDDFSGDTETRLSAICYWVLQLENSGEEYGLHLPGVEIAPDQGALHRDRALRALALFETGQA